MLDRASDLSFCEPLSALVFGGKATSQDGSPVVASGVSTANNLIVLRNLFAEIGPAATLEVGLAYGGSALVFCQSHQDAGNVPAGQHVALDPFQADMKNSGLRAVADAGFDGYLRHIEEFSDVALPALVAEGRRFGLIYIDGSHLFEDVFIDFYYCLRLLEPGGVMVFDDCADPHVAKVLAFLRSNMAHAVQEMDVSAYRADGGQSLRYRVARMLRRTQLVAFRRIGEPRRNWDSPFGRF